MDITFVLPDGSDVSEDVEPQTVTALVRRLEAAGHSFLAQGVSDIAQRDRSELGTGNAEKMLAVLEAWDAERLADEPIAELQSLIEPLRAAIHAAAG